MTSLLCLRFINAILDWKDERTEFGSRILNKKYQRLKTDVRNEKVKQPQGTITIVTIQPYGKIMREDESDVPYTEDSDMDETEYIYPTQRFLGSKENLGKLYFSFTLKSDPSLKSSKLAIKLLSADELPEARSENLKVYVTINLRQHDSNNTENQEIRSKVVQGTYSPRFDECFEMSVATDKIEKTVLRFIVWYVDNFSQGECLGMVEHGIGNIKNDGNNDEETVYCKDVQRITRDLQDNSMYRNQGAVLFSVAYCSTKKQLTVVVFKAQNLILMSDDNQGIYAEVTILHLRKNQRKRKMTRSMLATKNPVYNEVVLFDLTGFNLCDIKLQITLKQRRTDKADVALGKVVMTRDSCASDTTIQWNNIISGNKTLAQWYNLQKCKSYNNNKRKLRVELSCSDSDNDCAQR